MKKKKTHLTQQSNPLKKKKHIFLLSRLLGVVYQAGGPVTRRPTKRKISFKNKHCLALLLFLNCFIFFSQRKPHQKHEKGKIESGVFVLYDGPGRTKGHTGRSIKKKRHLVDLNDAYKLHFNAHCLFYSYRQLKTDK